MPDAYNLGKAGKEWWRWAWSTPQAMAWDGGALYTLARRAQLEDLHDALEYAEQLDFAELFADPAEAEGKLTWLISSLKALAGGSITVMKEMRELDGKLGLSPKAMAELRWKIVADDQAAAAKPAPKAAPKGKAKSNVRQLRPHRPGAAAG